MGMNGEGWGGHLTALNEIRETVRIPEMRRKQASWKGMAGGPFQLA